jgi:serine/threonine protein phosphatase PrpC
MGAIMSSPLTAVHIQRRSDSEVSVGCSSLQGWRTDHEDAHIIQPENGLFGVCDGHAGDRAAAYTAKRLPQLLPMKVESFTDAEINSSFLKLDAEYRREANSTDGCTCVAIKLEKKPDGDYSLVVMNVGDSRCLFIRPSNFVSANINSNLGAQLGGKSEELGLLFETKDHKPDEIDEKARIERCGGFVSTDEPARVDGVIAVSRVVGDFAYKADEAREQSDQKMIVVPDITRLDAKHGDLVVLACDGIFEAMSSEEVTRQILVRMLIHGQQDLGKISMEILDQCLKWESKDNMTMMILRVGGDGKEIPEDMKFEEEELALGDFETKPEQKDKYEAFFKKCGFPVNPSACEVCGRVFKNMSQCPCRTAIYCGVHCQRSAWKDHKKKCAAHKSKQKSTSK